MENERRRQMNKNEGWGVWVAWSTWHFFGFPLGLILAGWAGRIFWEWMNTFVFRHRFAPVNQYRAAESAGSVIAVVVFFLAISVAQQLWIIGCLEKSRWFLRTWLGLIGGFLLAWSLNGIAPKTSLFFEGFFLGGVVGTVVGVAQWLALRRQFYGAGWWVLASITGSGVSFALVLTGVGIAEKSLLMAWLISPLIGGLFGLISGASLPHMLSCPKRN